MPSCKRCGGGGYILVDDLHVRQCVCAYAKDMKSYLGPLIAGAQMLDASPLYVPGGDDLTDECVVLKGPWDDVIAHLKWVLFHKGLRFRYRLTTDEKLVSVYLGKESYGQRSKVVRDDTETYNGLMDLIGEDFSLIIIRLGCLGYPNKAAPGILKEALMMRETMGKPTWLIETPDSVWGEGHRSYSHEVGQYVVERYREVAIRGRVEVQPVASPDGDDVGLEDVPEESSAAQDQRRGPSVFKEVEVSDDAPVGAARVGKCKDWRGKRRGSGGRSGGGSGLSGPGGMPV